MKRIISTCLIVLAVGSIFGDNVSAPKFIMTETDTSSFWRTVSEFPLSLPVEYPPGAKTATLTVDGIGYHRVYEVSENPFSLDLSRPTTAWEENVYDLTLSFDDGTTRRAKVGAVRGVAAGSEADGVRCVFDSESKLWRRISGDRAVLSVPAGMVSLTVNGDPMDPGLGGAPGWCALGFVDGENYDLRMETAEFEAMASLYARFPQGLMLIFR